MEDQNLEIKMVLDFENYRIGIFDNIADSSSDAFFYLGNMTRQRFQELLVQYGSKIYDFYKQKILDQDISQD